MKTLCIYCGSSMGTDSAYADAARALAKSMIDQNLGLVYGGGNIGLMGAIANEVLRLGGDVTGIIPKTLLEREVGHLDVTRLHIVKDMHERKAMMAELSDGFIAMPGGIGTLEEFFETFTWLQLGLHAKPIGLFNVAGFYDGLIRFLDHVVQQGFLKPQQAALLIHESAAETLLARLKSFVPPFLEQALGQRSAKTLLP